MKLGVLALIRNKVSGWFSSSTGGGASWFRRRETVKDETFNQVFDKLFPRKISEEKYNSPFQTQDPQAFFSDIKNKTFSDDLSSAQQDVLHWAYLIHMYLPEDWPREKLDHRLHYELAEYCHKAWEHSFEHGRAELQFASNPDSAKIMFVQRTLDHFLRRTDKNRQMDTVQDMKSYSIKSIQAHEQAVTHNIEGLWSWMELLRQQIQQGVSKPMKWVGMINNAREMVRTYQESYEARFVEQDEAVKKEQFAKRFAKTGGSTWKNEGNAFFEDRALSHPIEHVYLSNTTLSAERVGIDLFRGDTQVTVGKTKMSNQDENVFETYRTEINAMTVDPEIKQMAIEGFHQNGFLTKGYEPLKYEQGIGLKPESISIEQRGNDIVATMVMRGNLKDTEAGEVYRPPVPTSMEYAYTVTLSKQGDDVVAHTEVDERSKNNAYKMYQMAQEYHQWVPQLKQRFVQAHANSENLTLPRGKHTSDKRTAESLSRFKKLSINGQKIYEKKYAQDDVTLSAKAFRNINDSARRFINQNGMLEQSKKILNAVMGYPLDLYDEYSELAIQTSGDEVVFDITCRIHAYHYKNITEPLFTRGSAAPIVKTRVTLSGKDNPTMKVEILDDKGQSNSVPQVLQGIAEKLHNEEKNEQEQALKQKTRPRR